MYRKELKEWLLKNKYYIGIYPDTHEEKFIVAVVKQENDEGVWGMTFSGSSIEKCLDYITDKRYKLTRTKRQYFENKNKKYGFLICEGNILHGTKVEIMYRTDAGRTKVKILEDKGSYGKGSIILMSPGEVKENK
jgi:hypothetical protein